MPNWVTNQIHMKGEKDTRQKVVEFLKGEGTDVDFNNIVEMPEELRNTVSGSIADEAWDIYEAKVLGNTAKMEERLSWPWVVKEGLTTIEALMDYIEKKNPDTDFVMYGKQLHDLHDKFGCHDWYVWACRYWGTKWNASEAEANEDYICFNTAWSCVLTLIQKLSCLFPTVTFEYAWADEDFGNNLGKVKFIAGVDFDAYIPDGGSKEAYKLAEEILGWAPDWDEEVEEDE